MPREPAETPQPTGLLTRGITDEINHLAEEHREDDTEPNAFHRRSVKLREMIHPLRTQITDLDAIQLFQEPAVVAAITEARIKWTTFHGHRNSSY